MTHRECPSLVDEKLTPDDVGVGEHEVWSEILEMLFVHVEVDISNLAGGERLCRRPHFIEEGYRQERETKCLGKSAD